MCLALVEVPCAARILLTSPTSSPFLPLQENGLKESLHVDPTDLKTSSAAITDKIMAAPLPTCLL